jgi:hypothetical protein
MALLGVLGISGVSFPHPPINRPVSTTNNNAFFIFICLLLIDVNENIPDLQAGYNPLRRNYPVHFSKQWSWEQELGGRPFSEA